VSFDLSRGRVEIETQEVEHLEERPDLRGSDGAPLMRTHDLADHLRVVHRLARNEPGCREAMRVRNPGHDGQDSGLKADSIPE
jgi:hypothetical protein